MRFRKNGKRAFVYIVYFIILLIIVLLAKKWLLPARMEEGISFIWGVNIKPKVTYQPEYSETNGVSFSEQLNYLNDLGVTWARVPLYNRVNMADNGSYEFIVNTAGSRGIKVLPFVMFTRDPTNSKSTYEQAKDFAASISSRFKGKITHYELGNETDLESIKSSNYNGDLPSHYDDAKYQVTLDILRGISDGIHQGDPSAKTMVSVSGWMHYGYIDRLILDQFNFDIISWHWYSEMGDITNTCNKATGYCINIAQKLFSYNKDIWVTEQNIRKGTQMNSEQQQADYITQTASQMSQLPNFKAYFVYELFDSAHLGLDNPEAYYGLIKMKSLENKWQVDDLKLGYGAYKNLIKPTSAVSSSIKPPTNTPPVLIEQSISATPSAELSPGSISSPSFETTPPTSDSLGMPLASSLPMMTPKLSSGFGDGIKERLIEGFNTGVQNVFSFPKTRWLFNIGGGILIAAGLIYLWICRRRRITR